MDWAKFKDEKFNELDPVKRQAAADFLHTKFWEITEDDGLTQEDLQAFNDDLVARVRESPEWIHGRPGEWPLHFNWGMTIRNLLRDGGFGEDYLGVENLDDYYVPLVELAVGARSNDETV